MPVLDITTAYASRGDGLVKTYTKNGTSWQKSGVNPDNLESQQDSNGNLTGWIYTTEQHETEYYDAKGKLTRIVNRNGITTTLTYSDGSSNAPNGGVIAGTSTALPAGLLIRITDHYGRSLNLFYDDQSRIVKMTDPANGLYQYSYSNGNLAQVTYPDNKTRQYLYEDAAHPEAITGIVDESNTRFSTYSYDSRGRATSSEHANGVGKVSLTYNDNCTTTEIDALGTSRTFSFQTRFGALKGGSSSQPGGSGCGAASSTTDYDNLGNVAGSTDFNGNKTCYAYDAYRNLETYRIEGLPAGSTCPTDFASYTPPSNSVIRKTSTEWHATWRHPAKVAEPLLLTSYSYDTHGNLTQLTRQATSDSSGAQGTQATVTGTARSYVYSYNSNGQLTGIDGPRSDVSDTASYTYDAQGNLISVTNALGQITQLDQYDAHGRPGRVTDANGVKTEFNYDTRGRLTSQTRRSADNTQSETTTYRYHNTGLLSQIEHPSGIILGYHYDAAQRLTDILGSEGSRIHYTLDNAGNRIKEEIKDMDDKVLQSHSRSFDALNRLWQDIGAVNQTTVFEYDANGNLTKVTDPLNRSTTHQYDALNRLILSTAADSGITRYGYDGQDQLSQVTDPRNLVTQYTRNGLGELQQRTSPDTGTSQATFDAAGNMLTHTDAKGQQASYSYDALNRLTQIRYNAADGSALPTQTINYQYDQGSNAIGKLSSITDATGNTSYQYDNMGRLSSESKNLAGNSYATQYRYDNQGRLNQLIYPSGREVNYSFDLQGRIQSITTRDHNQVQAQADALVVVNNIKYHPFGGIKSYQFGDGTQRYTRNLDSDGRIADYTLNGQVTTLSFDAASQLTGLNTASINAHYNYDPVGRLTSYLQGSQTQSYNYDLVGNRTSQTLGTATTSYQYPNTSNRQTGIQKNGNNYAIQFDANGTITQDIDYQQNARQYQYDVRGRLIQTTTASATANYYINALGQRVRKQSGNNDILYHYNTFGQLIAESNANRTLREYLYLGNQPVAVFK